jgi:Asp/Glu/hydantoin racemase
MGKLAIIHTTTATVEPLRALADELLPGCQVFNIVDDSILPRLAENGGDLSAVAGRVAQYMRFAAEAGADVILEACSSIGELVAPNRALLPVPLVRIDEAMADAAVARGERIGVAATLATTLEPTKRLLLERAALAGKAISLTPALAATAYQRLMAGDRAGHDAALAEALLELAPQVDCVVLAQASMARVLPQLPEAQREKFLTSPRLAMEQVREALARGG